MQQKVVIVTGCSVGGIGAHLCVSALVHSPMNPNIDTYLPIDASSWQNAAAGKYMRRHGILEK